MAVSLTLATTTGTAARLDPATLIDAARFRAEFGFAADPAVIQAAESDQNANRDWGVALLPAEAAEMARRDAIEDRLGPLNRYLAARPGFGGAYIDQRAGHIIDIAFTADAAPSLAELDPFLPAGSRYRTRVVQHTQAELRAVQDRMTADAAWFQTHATTMIEDPILVRDNVVELDLLHPTPAVIAAAQERYGQDLVRVVSVGPSELTACLSRDSCSPPLRAGLQLYDAGCSTGFIGIWNGQFYIITAGHCFISGHTYQHPNGTPLGLMVDQSFHDNTTADAGIVSIPSNLRSRYIYRTATSIHPVFSTQAQADEMVGQSVCLSGRKRPEGNSCGTVYAIDFTFNACVAGTACQQPDEYTVLLHQRSGTYGVAIGDSGGAVYRSGSIAMGIQSSINTAGRGIYGHITNVTSELDISVCIVSCQ
jgi:hypothetical protein